MFETESSTNTDGVEIAPPRMRLIDENNVECGILGVIATQQSQITTESSLAPDPVPQFQGPTMYQQLQMGNPSFQPTLPSRVQIRAPPPSTYGAGHFTNRNHITLQSESSRIIYAEGGQKFMDSSSKGDKNGKKKVG